MDRNWSAFPQLGFDKLLSLRSIAFAQGAFEPFPVAIIPEPVLEALVEVGMVETGPSCRPAVAPRGCRLTAEGWQVACAHWSIRRQKEPRLAPST